MIPPTATTHNKRRCMLNIMENPMAAIAAAMAYTRYCLLYTSGTANNDAYQEIRAQINGLNKQMMSIYESMSDTTLTDRCV